MENRSRIIAQVREKAEKFRLDWKLLDGLICAESAYDRWAVRFEKNTNLVHLPDKFSKLNRVSLDTEAQLQKFSYGLGQLMGYTARGLGFNGPLMQLCEIELNLHYMCRMVENLSGRYRFQGDIISAYNLGTMRKKDKSEKYLNQDYVDKVQRFINFPVS